MTCKVLYYFIFINTFFLDKVILANVVVSSSEVPIVYCLGDKNVMQTIVSMESAVRNMNEDSFYKFILFVPNNFTQDSTRKFTIFQKKYSNKCDVSIMRMSDEDSKYPPEFYSLFIPDKLKDRFAKVIYIDGDTIIRGDLSELYETGISINDFLAGVCDCRVKNNTERVRKIVPQLIEKNNELGGELAAECKRYINSGVIIFNVFRINDCKIHLKDKFISIWKTGITLSACDIVNIICCYDAYKKIIALKYNMNLKIYGLEDKCVEKFMNRKDIDFFKEEEDEDGERLKAELKEAIKDPVIVHFMDEHKPWKSRIGCMREYYNEWLNIFNEIKREYGFEDLKAKRKCCCGHVGLRA